MKKISLVISVVNRESSIYDNLAYAEANTTLPHEYLIVLDGCSDGSEGEVGRFQKDHPRADVKVLQATGVGEPVSNNVAARQATGDYIIILPDDVRLLEYAWDQRLTLPFDLYPDVFAVSGHCAHNWGVDTAHPHFHLKQLPREEQTAFLNDRLDWADKTNTRRDCFRVRASAARGPLAIDHADLRKLGYFDERYAPLGKDDHDVCFRARKELGKVSGLFKIDFVSGRRGNGHGNDDDKIPQWMLDTWHKNSLHLYHTHGADFASLNICEDRYIVAPSGGRKVKHFGTLTLPGSSSLTDSPPDASENTFDALVGVIQKDEEAVMACALSILRHLRGVDRVYICGDYRATSSDPRIVFIQDPEEESKKKRIREYLHGGRVDRTGWYYQQLMKLDCFRLTGSSKKFVLTVDADLIFNTDIDMIENGVPLYTVGREYHAPYFKHMERLLPAFRKSTLHCGIFHHLMYQRDVLERLRREVEEVHQMPFEDAYMLPVDPAENSGAAENELYFHYVVWRQAPHKFRYLRWLDLHEMNNRYPWQMDDYDFLAVHAHVRYGFRGFLEHIHPAPSVRGFGVEIYKRCRHLVRKYFLSK